MDLDRVGFIDAAGLGVLVGAANRANSHGGDVELVCSREATLWLLRLTGLTRRFAVHARLADLHAPAPNTAVPASRIGRPVAPARGLGAEASRRPAAGSGDGSAPETVLGGGG